MKTKLKYLTRWYPISAISYIKQALKSELEKLKESKSKWKESGDQFLMFIYETYPPKTKYKVPKKADVIGQPKEKLKKLFQKAVISYHPDKQDVKKFGMKWKVLSEEITKMLTNFYEVYKTEQ